MAGMIKKGLTIFTGVALLGLAIGGFAWAIDLNSKLNSTSGESNLKSVKVYSTNDMHGRLIKNGTASAGAQSIAGFLSDKTYDLLLDGGDMIQGQALSDVDKGHTMASIAADMGYDGIAVGNHEFDFGLENIVAIDAIPGTNFLSANTRYRLKDDEGNVTNNPGERVFDASRIVNIGDGVRAGIIGLTTLDTSIKTHPDNVKDLVFTDLIDETKKEIEMLEKQGIDLIIVVSHVGAVRNDVTGSTVQLAEALSDKIDLIVDGHTQVDYNKPVKTDKGTTQIIQTGEYTDSIRETNFVFNKKTGLIENFDSKKIPYSEISNQEAKANPIIEKRLTALRKLEGEINNVEIIPNAPIMTDLGTNGIHRRIEKPMTSMVSDANLWATKQVENEALHADFAIMNTGGVRVSLPQGQLLRRNLFEVLPFGNQLRIVELPGSTVQQIMDYGMTQQASGSFISISDSIKLNVTATLNETPEEGTGVNLIDKTQPIDVDVQIKNASGTFEALDPEKNYKMATNDFLLAGGDGYTMLNLNDPEVASKVKVIAEQGDMLVSLTNFVKYLASTPELLTQWSTKYAADAAPSRILITNRTN